MVRLTSIRSPWPAARTPPDRLGLQGGAVGGPQHDAAAVGFDGAKHQFENALQEIVQVENVAYCLAGLVHDRQVGQGGAQPRGLGIFRLGQNTAAFGVGNRFDDRRRQLQVLARDQTDFFREVAGVLLRLQAGGAEDQQGLANEDLIAWAQRGFFDLLPIDKGAVGAALVDHRAAAARRRKIRHGAGKPRCRAAAKRCWRHGRPSWRRPSAQIACLHPRL